MFDYRINSFFIQLLDFPKYPEWHSGFAFESADATKQTLERGDKLHVKLDGMKFTSEVKVCLSPVWHHELLSNVGQENSEALLQWQGPPVYRLVAGLHSFQMEPTSGGSCTIFKHTETFTGILSFAMTPSLLGKKLQGQFEQFNKDIKARAEGMKAI